MSVDAGTVTLSPTPATVDEGDMLTITITLDLPGTGVTLSPPLTGVVISMDGTAGRPHKINMYTLCILCLFLFPDSDGIPPDDYNAVIFPFSFATEGAQTFQVVTIDDGLVEGDETLSLMLTNIVGPANPGPNLGVTIIDDDGKLPHPHRMHDTYVSLSLLCMFTLIKHTSIPSIDNAVFPTHHTYSALSSSNLQLIQLVHITGHKTRQSCHADLYKSCLVVDCHQIIRI